MIRRLLVAWCLFIGALLLAQQPKAFWHSVVQSAISAGGGCTQATNFLARTSGLSGTAQTNYTNFLCGLETDSVGCSSKLDALYILGAPDSTTAGLNLCSSSFAVVVHGTPTFAANAGYTGTGLNNYLDTQYAPAGAGFYTQNAASLYVYVLNNRTTGAGVQTQTGASNGGFTQIAMMASYSTTLGAEVGANDAKTDYTNAAGTSQGCYIASRNTSTTGLIRRNAATFATISLTSSGLPGQSFFVFDINQGGGVAGAVSTDQVFALGFGGSLATTADMDAVCNRTNTFANALGINVY